MSPRKCVENRIVECEGIIVIRIGHHRRKVARKNFRIFLPRAGLDRHPRELFVRKNYLSAPLCGPPSVRCDEWWQLINPGGEVGVEFGVLRGDVSDTPKTGW